MISAYKFLDFILKTEEMSLYHQRDRLELGLKGFKLLALLVQNQGKIVSKDDLIRTGWENQIVTDGTLSKQIERIRQNLSAFYPDDVFIETVRGIGYTFIPHAQALTEAELNPSANRRAQLKKWQKAIAIVSLIPLLVFLYFLPLGVDKPPPAASPLMPFNLAVIPAASGDNYLLLGGLSYLSNLLDKNPQVLSLSPQSKWFKAEDKQKFAIELQNQKSLDYALLVNLLESQHQKTAHLKLTNYNDTDITASITASDFKTLFAQINNWLRYELKLDPASESNNFNQALSDDSFALESYFRGLKESKLRNYSKAIDFYQTALHQDPEFYLAHIRMAEALILSSDYVGAKSILDILAVKDLSIPTLKLWIQSLQANIQVYSEQSQTAQALIKEALVLSRKLENTAITEKLLYLQTTIHLQAGRLDQAIESTLQQKKLLDSTTKDKSRLYRVDNNLAFLYQTAKRYTLAEKHIRVAIKYYEQINAIPALFSSYNILANTNYNLAQFESALLALQKASSLINEIENERLVLGHLESRAYLQIALGQHDQLPETLEQIEALAISLKTDEPKILALGAALDLAIQLKKPAAIQSKISRFSQLAKQAERANPLLAVQMLHKLVEAALVLDDIILAEDFFNQLESLTQDKPQQWQDEYQYLKGLILLKKGQTKSALTILNEIFVKSLDQQHKLQALKTAYVLMDIAVENQDYPTLEKLVQAITPLQAFPYPFLRYKALLAAQQTDFFNASKYLQEMKNSSNQWWQTEDQRLLQSYIDKI